MHVFVCVYHFELTMRQNTSMPDSGAHLGVVSAALTLCDVTSPTLVLCMPIERPAVAGTVKYDRESTSRQGREEAGRCEAVELPALTPREV